jgi:hypothetical protein
MRFVLILIVVGGFLIYMGYQEYRVSGGESSEPEEVDLAEVEKGNVPENTYLKIKEHVALYPAAVYSYSAKSEQANPPASTSVNYSFHPIISTSHPFATAIEELASKQIESENIQDFEVPEIKEFAVIVKTEKFETIGDIPENMRGEDSIEGLVINKIDSLDKEEKELLKQSFPSADLDKVLILEDGRKPAPMIKWLGMIGGGILLIVVGIGILVRGRSTPPTVSSTPTDSPEVES